MIIKHFLTLTTPYYKLNMLLTVAITFLNLYVRVIGNRTAYLFVITVSQKKIVSLKL